MGRALRIGIYSPFFGSTIGGGEKYLGVTAEVVRDDFPQATVEIVSPVPVDVRRYEQMLGLDLHGLAFRTSNSRPSGLKRTLARMPALRRYRDLFVGAQLVRATAEYDLFISMVYVLPAFNRARRGVILCQFPYDRDGQRTHDSFLRRLYVQPYNRLRQLLFGGEVDDFQLIICQSEYVRKWVRELWARDSLVVNPPIDVPTEEPDWRAKQNIVLSVGRFFTGGHSKRHDVMVQAFRDLCDGGLRDWELHLVGSVHRDRPGDVEYFERVKRLALGYPVHIHGDARLEEIQHLYRRSAIYWHAAGYGADAHKEPATLEHFGMTTAEAMGHGAVPVAIGLGGQPEVVEDGVTGFLWTSTSELRSRTMTLMRDPQLRRQMGLAARLASLRFARAEFKRRMRSALAPLVRALELEVHHVSGGFAGSSRDS
jgi:glycosyltransferase involved in cell wall biosynthesis